MKRKKLTGFLEKAAKECEESFAADMLGYWYSRHCLGESVDRKLILEEAKEECGLVRDVELEPFTVVLETEGGDLRIRYRSTGAAIGYTYMKG